MCGFAGFFNIHRQHFAIDELLLNNMQQQLVHRGPDDVGIWKSDIHQLGLAFRRLKIIDLSQAAHQPMVDLQHQIVLVFNGEIYNHADLRKELEAYGYRYRSTSDTETIIFAYKQWGISFLERLEGMFAIVLFDLKKNKLFLIRDRMGVKPLYFSLQGGVLSFASEIKALWALPWLEKKIGDRAAYHYLTFMVTPAPMTIFEEIYKLPAGFYAEVDEHRRISFKEWYNPVKQLSQAEKKEYQSEDFCIEKIRTLLLESTKKRMVADVPVGAFLSGGLDSSLNVALMSRFHNNIKSFTIAFADQPESNELGWARRVAKHFGTDHHEIMISEKEAFDFYHTMVQQLDEPLADCVCIPFYYVAKLAHDHGMKVVQVGEGADELFFGYPSYAQYAQVYNNIWKPSQLFLPAFMRKGLASATWPLTSGYPLRREVIANWAKNRPLFWGGALAFGEEQKKNCRPKISKHPLEQDQIIDQIYPGMRQVFDSQAIVDYHLSALHNLDPEADFAKQMLYLELKQRLPELLLMRADKMAMATSIEAREPFLDHKLVECLLHIPSQLKFKNNITKYLLKKSAEGILPNDIIYRKKVGFGAPTTQWFTQGKYFPAYFSRLAEDAGRGGMHGLAPVGHATNKNEAHRAVQNWVLQQLWSFSSRR